MGNNTTNISQLTNRKGGGAVLSLMPFSVMASIQKILETVVMKHSTVMVSYDSVTIMY